MGNFFLIKKNKMQYKYFISLFDVILNDDI